MKLISFQKLGKNRNSPRLWLESRRLEALGFTPGTPFAIERKTAGIELRVTAAASNHVSGRTHARRIRPVIDVCSRASLEALLDFPEIKVAASFRRIQAAPSFRGFHLRRRFESRAPFRILELFCGGGTLSAAIAKVPEFTLVAGVEVEPKYADVWQDAHRGAVLFQADVRQIHAEELPAHDVLVASIPCTSHSMLGRTKKSLAGKPELGDSGDLFMCVAHLVEHHLPLACVFENVPSFGSSLAGLSLMHHLQQVGYVIAHTVVNPWKEWGEPQDRRRWIMVATLKPGFQICAPDAPFIGTIADYLDAPSDSDKTEVERIAGSINALRLHRARHQKLGHGFGFSTINRESSRVPTIVRSYHKINTGPFVETPHGLRLLHKAEVERLMGCEIDCDHYATAIEILGQGVQTRVFQNVLQQLARFLCG